VLDISIAYSRYKFLGFEFLTWLWFTLEKYPNTIQHDEFTELSLKIGNRMVIENAFHNSIETVTIKGDDAGLEEGMLALRKGGVITEMNMIAAGDRQQWQFTLKGESLAIAALKIQNEMEPENQEDMEAQVIDRIFTCERIVDWIYHLFNQFIKLRLSDKWKNAIIPDMHRWIEKTD
jgi:hypothetical protein